MNQKLTSRRTLLSSILEVTKAWAEMRSKDPSTKVGACLYDMKTGGMFMGYNGFPQGFPDEEHIWTNTDGDTGIRKYDVVVHAEVNAVRKALQGGADMRESMLVVTHWPCSRCMKDVIASCGIKQVFYGVPTYPSLTPHDAQVTQTIANVLGIVMDRVEEP